MGASSKIGWTEATWNPLVGCEHCSPGCDGCYAARDAFGRLRNVPVYQGLAIRREAGERPRFTGEVRLLTNRLDEPLHWAKPRFIFVNSMSDLFHKDVPDAFIADVVVTMAMARQHNYQVLTKRPQRMGDLLGDTDRWLDLLDAAVRRRGIEQRIFAELVPGSEYPMPWAWFGTSIESNQYTFRARHAARAVAALRFLSVEPLLSDVPSLNLDGIGWVIAGGESGPQSRPTNPDWFRRIRDLCAEADVPFFLKQMGAPWAKEHGLAGKGDNIDDFPADLRIQQQPPFRLGIA